jgi:hypothetical protein
MLVEQGASLQNVCFNKTIRQHIMENMPELKLEGMARCRPPLAKQTSTSVLENLAQIVDRAGLGKVNFLEYFILNLCTVAENPGTLPTEIFLSA